MYFTYVLKEKNLNHYYVGSTKDLENRLSLHKLGKVKATKGRNWDLHYYFAFKNESICRNLEQYLKSGSGRAFCKRHFDL